MQKHELGTLSGDEFAQLSLAYYYADNNPVIADAAYDQLLHRLEELEDRLPDLKAENSPTRTVGTPPVDPLKKRKHLNPMLSLQAALSSNEIHNYYSFIERKAGKNTAPSI